MNRELFSQMQRQLEPSPEAEAALKAKLERAKTKGRVRWGRYVAVAACAALAVAAVPIYGALNPPLHAYAVGDGGAAAEHGEVLSLTGDKDDLQTGAPNTGDLPGGAVVEVPVQEEAAAAYEALMDHIDNARKPWIDSAQRFPDWYGGAYIDEYGDLVVCVVGAPLDDKSLYLEIQDLCGSQAVAFREAKYTLNELNALQEEVAAQLLELDFGQIAWATGVDEENNQVTVALPFAIKKVLAQLQRLDPAGDAISVTVGEHEPVPLVEATPRPVVELPAAKEEIAPPSDGN